MSDQATRYEITRKWAALSMLCLSPIPLVFVCFGQYQTGVGAWVCSGIVTMAARVRWDLRNHIWYWVVLAFGVLLQVPLIVLIPWTNGKLNYFNALPIAVLDYLVLYGCIKLVEKLLKRA